MPVIYNLMDDTGREIVNALRRMRARLSGRKEEELPIDYRDHHMIILDRTGKLIAEAIEGVTEQLSGEAAGGLATAEKDGLMDRRDKQKLDAFLPADFYAGKKDIEGCMRYLGEVRQLPGEAAAGDCCGMQGNLYLYDGSVWICSGSTAEALSMPELEALLREWEEGND